MPLGIGMVLEGCGVGYIEQCRLLLLVSEAAEIPAPGQSYQSREILQACQLQPCLLEKQGTHV